MTGTADCHVVRPDAAVLALARRQHGVVTARQLRGLGWSADVVAHRVARGWLVRLHRGVYRVGPLASPHEAAMAAVLACGRGALLSHGSAAALWDLVPSAGGQMHVLVVGRNVRARPGIRIHRTADLRPADAARHHGIPVISPARTLLDLAATTPEGVLARAVEHALIHHLTSDRLLNEQLSRYPRHRGAAAIRAATSTDPHLTRSEAERRLLDLVRRGGLPQPETNVRIAGHEVDALWRDERLVVEVDGYAFHSTRAAFERDRRRDADLQAAGLRVLRVTWRRIVDEPEALLVALARCLS